MSKIQINYKSGNSVVVDLENMNPRPLFLGLADVESVWVLEDGNEKE